MKTLQEVDDVVLDFSRQQRIGLPEAVLCEGKTAPQLVRILQLCEQNKTAMLLTRLSSEAFRLLPGKWKKSLDFDPVSRTAFFRKPQMAAGVSRVAIVSAGSSDTRVVLECQRTLAFAEHPCTVIQDVGVAGLWRLQKRLKEIAAHPIVIVVAGMDAALPSVVGGLVAGALIGVPTSTGYGVATGGHTALHSMLASCAQGIAVMNIDNGYGAACSALRMLNSFERLR
jgi:pyridinium-3,5-biscarboxylic acid mononucleotide synthase